MVFEEEELKKTKTMKRWIPDFLVNCCYIVSRFTIKISKQEKVIRGFV